MALRDASGRVVRTLLAGASAAHAAASHAAAAGPLRSACGARPCGPLPPLGGISALALHAAGEQLRGLRTHHQPMGAGLGGSLLARGHAARGLALPLQWGISIGGTGARGLHAPRLAPPGARRHEPPAAAATAAGGGCGSDGSGWGSGGALSWEAQWRGFAAGGAQTKDEPAAGAAKVLPDAQECDEAIEKYREVRTSRRPPPSYRTVGQRAKDMLAAVVNGIIVTVRFVLSAPGRLWALRLKTREQWAADWASLKKTVKHEAHHYWIGAKLLAADVRIASGLALKAARGNTLTRRERRQLTRTTADMFRLVPMIIILVIPFMELALPLLLKLFPNMLPSTFEDKLKKEEELKRRLVAKMEVAKFLQDTMAEMASDIKAKRTGEVSASADELFRFINKVRAGAPVDSNELVKFARLFNDELTLDRLDRVQLVSMCQLLSIPPYGTDGFLRNRLRSHLDKIKLDDRLILAEGLDNLNADELRSVCKARGVRAAFGDGAVPYMRNQMKGWLDLSQQGLPSSLLLLSRALVLQPTTTDADGQLVSVRDTLLTLPEEVIQDVGLEVGAGADAGGAAELQKRLELTLKEQAMIKQEAAAAKELEAKQKAAAVTAGAADSANTVAVAGRSAAMEQLHDPAADVAVTTAAEEQEAAARNAAAVAAASAVLREAAAGAFKDAMERGAAEALTDKGVSEEERAAQVAAEKERRMQDIISALTVLASSSGVATERAEFMKLVKREVHRLQDTVGEQSAPQLFFTSEGLHAVRPEDPPSPETVHALRAPLALEERVGGILMRLEKELDDTEKAIGERLHVIDLDNDGLISKGELEEALRFLKANLTEDELHALLEKLQIKEGGGDVLMSVGTGAAASNSEKLISVSELAKLAEVSGKSDGGNTTSAPKDTVQVHIR